MTLDQTKLDKLTDGLTYSAEFVPYSKAPHRDGANGKRWECISWRIRLVRNGVTLETGYAQGTGHIPPGFIDNGRKASPVMRKRLESAIIESGRACVWQDGPIEPCQPQRNRPLPPPPLPDVLSSLILDGSAIDYPDFEDWCSEYGENPDSRKAEQCYRQCVETGLKLRAMFGDNRLEGLRELFADY